MTTTQTAPLRWPLIAAYWFAFSFHWFLLLPILMPKDVLRFVGEENKGTYLGVLQGLLAIIPLVAPPFLGAWSDRVGKRLPFLIWGTALNLAGLLFMMLAPNFWMYALAYAIVQSGNTIASTPYNALIPDLIRHSAKGRASGVIGLYQLLGQILGGVAAFALGGGREGQYLAVVLVLALGTAITVLSTPEPERETQATHDLRFEEYLEPNYRDFRWVFLTRSFMETGRFAVQPFLQFYLSDVIRVFALGTFIIKDAGLALTFLLMALSVTAAITAIISGPLSDRIGKKPVLYFACALMAIAAFGFALSSSYPVALLMGLFFGLGYGAFVSVDWALGTSVLPNPAMHARDMGVWHIAMVLPQVFQGPFGSILDNANKANPNSGYMILFVVAVVFFVLSGAFTARVRGVK